jgi:hypothetical protein
MTVWPSPDWTEFYHSCKGVAVTLDYVQSTFLGSFPTAVSLAPEIRVAV